MSSTQPARCGTRSLIHLPHWPCCFHVHGLFMHAPGRALEQLDLAAGVELLAVPLDQRRLVVERVALAGRAGHEQLHDPLGPGPVMQAAVRGRRAAGGRGGEQPLAPEQVRQGDAAQTAAGVPEKSRREEKETAIDVLA